MKCYFYGKCSSTVRAIEFRFVLVEEKNWTLCTKTITLTSIHTETAAKHNLKMAHICEVNNCKGENFDGLFFSCYKCDAKSYFECVIEKEEVSNLLASIEMVTFVNSTPALNSAKKIVAKQMFDSIMGAQSLIKFTCQKCLDSDSSLMQENESLKQQIKTDKTRISKLNAQVLEQNIIIRDLTENNDNPNEIIERSNGSIRNESGVSAHDHDDALLGKVHEFLSAEIKKLTKKMTNECNKVKKFCTDKCAEIEDKTKCDSPKPNPFRVTDVDKKKKNKGVPYAPEPTDDEDDECDTNVNVKSGQKYVMPEQQNSANEQYVYAMHVSQFNVNKKVDEIVDIVMNHTSITDPSDFLVEKLSNHKSNYASFKISTKAREVYDDIKNIWHPHYYARDFRPAKNNFNSNMQTSSRFDRNVRAPPKSDVKQRRYNDRNEKSVRKNFDSRRHFPNKFNERENYETPKRHNDRRWRSNDVQKPPTPAPAPPPQPQYIYIPVQQPMGQLVQHAQPTFLPQPIPSHQIIPHTQQFYQTAQQQHQQPQQPQAL